MPIDKLLEQPLTHSVIGAFFEVYNTLGFGFVEAVYVRAMEQELRARGHGIERERRVPVWYKGTKLSDQRLDMLVDGRVVVEAKATYELHLGASQQLYNYLRATRLEVGLLLHFGPAAKFHRIVCFRASAGPELRRLSTESGSSGRSKAVPDVADPPDPDC